MSTIAPDCRDGKHTACTGDTWDVRADEPTDCDCACHGAPVDPHHPMVFQGRPSGLGTWVECECGWIGPSTASEQAARDSHAAHLEKIK